jgi:hypothetical protein
MKKSVRRVLLVGFLIVILTLVVSCTKNPAAAGENAQQSGKLLQQSRIGTEGIDIDVVDNLPPPVLYDENELVAVVEVRNKGSHPVGLEDCFIHVTGFDPTIIGGNFNKPRSCAENLGGGGAGEEAELEGKSVYNTDGGFNQIEFRSERVSLPDGVFEYEPNLNFLACYSYKTTANPSVCVDPLFYQVSAEQKACIPRNPSVGNGQGGPVSVSNVNVDMVGDKAVFQITIRNHGKGRVVSREADMRTCASTPLQYTDLDKVHYTVKMSGGSLISCRPHDFVRLNNNEAKIICTFNILSQTAFETPLSIELDYNYIHSFHEKIKIVDTPE